MKGRNKIQRLAILLWSCSILLLGSRGFAQGKPEVKSSFDNKLIGVGKQQQVTEACKKLDGALQHGDTITLKALLHEQLSLGHSNGLIENKEELLQHLRSGHLKYKGITEEGYAEVQLVQDIATVRRNLKVSGALNGEAFELRLKVLEVWIVLDGEWKLLCRQSVKKQ